MSWFYVAGLLAAGAVLPVWLRRPARSAAPLARARAGHSRLRHALETSDAPPERCALAQERLATCGALIADATGPRQLRLAEQVAAEGLALLEDGPP